MLFAGGDTQEPVAMAKVVIREAGLFGAEENGDRARGECATNLFGGVLQREEFVLQFAIADRRGPYDQAAVADRFRYRAKFLCAGQQRLGAYRGYRLAKCFLVRGHHAEVKHAEVAHGTSGGADVERVAGADEDHAQVGEIGVRHGDILRGLGKDSPQRRRGTETEGRRRQKEEEDRRERKKERKRAGFAEPWLMSARSL